MQRSAEREIEKNAPELPGGPKPEINVAGGNPVILPLSDSMYNFRKLAELIAPVVRLSGLAPPRSYFGEITMRSFIPFAMAFCCVTVVSMLSADDQPVTLLGTIAKWQYPESKISGAQMSDAATVDADGNRTAPSVLSKTTMTTNDSVKEVIDYYRTLLNRDPNADDKIGTGKDKGRSVIFSDDSEGRPFALHTVIVNTKNTSTTLIVSRVPNEDQTRITWKHYSRH